LNAAELLAAKRLRETTLNIEVEGGSVPFVLRAIPRKEYRQMMDDHPGGDGQDWNPDTFPPVLIAASAVDPEFSLDEATVLWDTWEDADATRIFLTCFNLNENPAGLSFTLPGFGKVKDSGQNSTTAPPSE